MSSRQANRPTVRRRDPDASRARILAAATAEFAAKGLGEARVDEIAARAGINKRMLYHYFGNKEKLFQAALEEVYETICVSGQTLELETMSPREGLDTLVDFVWNYYLTNPQSIALLNTENLHKARHLRKSKRVKALLPPFESTIRELLRRGEAAKVFRPSLDPVELYVTIVGLVYYYLSNSATLSVAFGRDLRTPDRLAGWRQHAREVVTRYVCTRPDDPGASPAH